MSSRRFPPPWTVHKVAGGCRVDDAAGQALAYVYGRDAHMAHQAKSLTWDEARRIAAGIARLPELMAARERATATDE
jgi:hypothetical protein